jgi:hypothetical protein
MTRFTFYPPLRLDSSLEETCQREPPASRTLFANAFDGAAMGVFPWVARAFGYTYRVGRTLDLQHDGRSVIQAVWGAKGLLPPTDLASFGARYDAGMTWIVAYKRGKAVGSMGLLDMRVASVALDYGRRLRPPGLDLATTREICRLAILPKHRGGAQLVMVGLLREMLAWSVRNGIVRLFSGSTEQLFNVYRRFNPTARIIDPPRDLSEDPTRERYYEKLRGYGGDGVLYTFDVDGASPWSVFSRFLTRNLKRQERR